MCGIRVHVLVNMNVVRSRPPRWPHPRTESLHPVDDFFSRPFNNSQKNSPTSPGYILGDHRALWSTDQHAQLLTAHPPSSRRYRAQ